MPVTANTGETTSEAGVRPGTLPGGFVATTTHTGPYDNLGEAHAAIQQWIEAEGSDGSRRAVGSLYHRSGRLS